MPIFDEWIVTPAPPDDLSLPVEHAAIRSLLIRRGVEAGESFRRFMAPSRDDLHDAAEIHGIDHACERIARATRDGEGILIYGDYDVDGVTSIVLLQTVLRILGSNVGFVVPHRLVDGYGLKIEVIERVLTERKVGLVITVDCGITSVEPVEMAIARGIDVIITDHHLPPGVLPAAAAVLNPKQPGCEYPFKDLAGVGVVFKLCCELLRRSGRKVSIDSLMKIAAIGTVADVAPLVGENRTIVSLGLQGLADPRNPGLRALMRRLGLLGRPLRASDVGFKIGPRINAAGRLASADTAIELFEAADEESAWALCATLDRLNAERQQIEIQVREAAEAQVDSGARILVLAGEGWHRGVLGLSAGRIAQKYHRPTLMIAIDGERCVGSARSIGAINLHEQLDAVSELFQHFGGHEFACGFSLAAANLPELRARLTERFAALEDGLFRKMVSVDAEVTLSELDQEFLKAHEMLQPFGAGNVQPLFLARGLDVLSSREFSERCFEWRVRDRTGSSTAIVWPSTHGLADLASGGKPVDLLFQLEPDQYAGGRSRMIIVDGRFSE